MAICPYCDQEMTKADSCIEVLFHGEVLPVPYGLEHQEHAWVAENARQGFRCFDCNVVSGAFHHPGCDKEEHPLHGEQAMGWT